MFCKKCGANLEEGQNVCPNCGYNVQDEKPFVAPTTNNATNVELDKTPISVVEYIGYFWVMVIPCAGLILAIVWAFTHKNENVRNYFKAVLINIVILLTANFTAKKMTDTSIF